MSKPSNPIDLAILANISALQVIAASLNESILSAHAAMREGNKNLAIGNLLDLDRLLPEADALYRAAIVLHCKHD